MGDEGGLDGVNGGGLAAGEGVFIDGTALLRHDLFKRIVRMFMSVIFFRESYFLVA